MIQTQIIYRGDSLQKLRGLPDACVNLIDIDTRVRGRSSKSSARK